jgi:hypothetical protein
LDFLNVGDGNLETRARVFAQKAVNNSDWYRYNTQGSVADSGSDVSLISTFFFSLLYLLGPTKKH